MEASAVNDRRRRHQRPQHTQHDYALIKAKREKRMVALVLAVDTPYAPDGECVVSVSHVDKNSVEIILDNGKKHWVSKAFIVSTGEPDD